MEIIFEVISDWRLKATIGDVLTIDPKLYGFCEKKSRLCDWLWVGVNLGWRIGGFYGARKIEEIIEKRK